VYVRWAGSEKREIKRKGVVRGEKRIQCHSLHPFVPFTFLSVDFRTRDMVCNVSIVTLGVPLHNWPFLGWNGMGMGWEMEEQASRA
jgi:hypothetical protein